MVAEMRIIVVVVVIYRGMRRWSKSSFRFRAPCVCVTMHITSAHISVIVVVVVAQFRHHLGWCRTTSRFDATRRLCVQTHNAYACVFSSEDNYNNDSDSDDDDDDEVNSCHSKRVIIQC